MVAPRTGGRSGQPSTEMRTTEVLLLAFVVSLYIKSDGKMLAFPEPLTSAWTNIESFEHFNSGARKSLPGNAVFILS